MSHRFQVPRSTKEVAHIKQGLVVQQSNIPDAGKGLFTTIEFSKNEYITFYDGELITREEALERRRRGQDSHIRSNAVLGDCIDGYTGQSIPDGSGGASIANHQAPPTANSRYDSRNGVTWLRANRNIRVGEEVTCDYGKAYWRLRE